MEASFVPLFQVMTSAQRDWFVGKTRSVKTGILKRNVNARVATRPSTGILHTVKVGLYFTRVGQSRGSWGSFIIWGGGQQNGQQYVSAEVIVLCEQSVYEICNELKRTHWDCPELRLYDVISESDKSRGLGWLVGCVCVCVYSDIKGLNSGTSPWDRHIILACEANFS